MNIYIYKRCQYCHSFISECKCEIGRIIQDIECCEICDNAIDFWGEKCNCPDINFINNIRTDGSVNCVGYFNNKGDSFFDLREITEKIKEIKDAIKYTNNASFKKEWIELLYAALSIKEKLNEKTKNKKKLPAVLKM